MPRAFLLPHKKRRSSSDDAISEPTSPRGSSSYPSDGEGGEAPAGTTQAGRGSRCEGRLTSPEGVASVGGDETEETNRTRAKEQRHLSETSETEFKRPLRAQSAASDTGSVDQSRAPTMEPRDQQAKRKRREEGEEQEGGGREGVEGGRRHGGKGDAGDTCAPDTGLTSPGDRRSHTGMNRSKLSSPPAIGSEESAFRKLASRLPPPPPPHPRPPPAHQPHLPYPATTPLGLFPGPPPPLPHTSAAAALGSILPGLGYLPLPGGGSRPGGLTLGGLYGPSPLKEADLMGVYTADPRAPLPNVWLTHYRHFLRAASLPSLFPFTHHPHPHPHPHPNSPPSRDSNPCPPLYLPHPGLPEFPSRDLLKHASLDRVSTIRDPMEEPDRILRVDTRDVTVTDDVRRIRHAGRPPREAHIGRSSDNSERFRSTITAHEGMRSRDSRGSQSEDIICEDISDSDEESDTTANGSMESRGDGSDPSPRPDPTHSPLTRIPDPSRLYDPSLHPYAPPTSFHYSTPAGFHGFLPGALAPHRQPVSTHQSAGMPPHPSNPFPGFPLAGRRPRDPSKAPATKRYQCDLCDKAFSRSNTLVTHRRIHTGEKPFKCEVCARAFRQPGNLTRHRLTHTTVKPYVCPVCRKAFNRASNLHTHMRTHANLRPFLCHYCGKGFHSKMDLKVHVYSHTGRQSSALTHAHIAAHAQSEVMVRH